MGRRVSREIAMKLLYQLEIQKEDRQEQIDRVLDENELTDSDKNYILNVLDGVNSNIVYLDKMIEDHSKGWKLNRLSKVDLSILRLGAYEISFRDDIPFNVAINEAVELAKRYSSEEAGSFINGILGKIPRDKVVSTENPVES